MVRSSRFALGRFGRSERLDALCVGGAAVLLVLLHAGIFFAKTPHFEGWWAGFDQSAYLRAARAWDAGNLDPAAHYYLPGYPLLGAVFAWLTPAQPFFLPDLACSVLVLWLFVRIARRLAPDVAHVPALAAAAVLLAMLTSRWAVAVWVVPWSSTPAAAAMLWALLAALRFAERPRGPRLFAAVFAGCLTAWMRPSDAASTLLCIGVYCGVCALREGVEARRWAGLALWAMGGGLAALVPLVLVHLAVHGFKLGAYIAVSRQIGFAWALIPRRWVTLVLGPAPLLYAGPGMVLRFPWIPLGMAGFLVRLRGPGRAATLLLGAAVAATWVLYLAYRDMQIGNFWIFYNYHYFKWTQPVLAFYGLLLVRALVVGGARGRLAGAAALAAVLLGLFAWQDRIRVGTGAVAAITTMPSGTPAVGLGDTLARLDGGAVLQPWSGGRPQPMRASVPGTELIAETLAPPGSLIVLPLRAVPATEQPVVPLAGPARPASIAPLRQSVRYGLPCLVQGLFCRTGQVR
jgi:hypothetical protein